MGYSVPMITCPRAHLSMAHSDSANNVYAAIVPFAGLSLPEFLCPLRNAVPLDAKNGAVWCHNVSDKGLHCVTINDIC